MLAEFKVVKREKVYRGTRTARWREVIIAVKQLGDGDALQITLDEPSRVSLSAVLSQYAHRGIIPKMRLLSTSGKRTGVYHIVKHLES